MTQLVLNRTRLLALLAMIVPLQLSSLSLAQGAKSEATPEPPVPAEIASAGTVYHTLTGREAQVTFTSRAPLENIIGKSNQVAGYLVAGPEDAPAALRGGEWVLPVRSLATGIPLRDRHIAKGEWLDASEHPMITFRLESVEDIEVVKSGEGFSTWSVTLVGEMTIRGVSNTIRVEDATISFLRESEKTTQIAPGDLCFLKCAYTLNMSDYDIHHKDVPEKVSDTIELSQMIRLSTVKPE